MKTQKLQLILFAFMVFSGFAANAQIFTKEDSLNAGLTPSNNPTVISGYGEAKVSYDLKVGTGEANLTRNVMFFGHRFSDKITFFSEMELEDGKVDGGGGEISMEQFFLKVNLNRDVYMVTGLFIPRIGIINENHLPTTFNGNDRPFVERYIIPSTWRELGVGIYGLSRAMPGLNYSFAVVNGLDASSFSYGKGIRDGRFEGREATASNIAVTGALLYYYKNWRMQLSGYYGGANGLDKKMSDSLKLGRGPFGTPVSVTEANIQYHNKGWQFKALATMINMPDAQKINNVYSNNTPTAMAGGYVELGYNTLRLFKPQTTKNFTLFARYEYLDMNSKIPTNALSDGYMKKHYFVTGITCQPTRGVSFKADYVIRTTGNYNNALYTSTPDNNGYAFSRMNQFVNLGMAYSF